MKKLLLFLICFRIGIIYSQSLRPESISMGYFGETITHPGFKLGAVYSLHNWEKSKTGKGGMLLKHKQIQLVPSLGFFFHKNYQTAVFLNPELVYARKKENGNYISYGLGLGYMRTFLPGVYSLDKAGEIQKTQLGYNYFISTLSVSFGRNLAVKNGVPLGIYIKPQCMYAIPNATRGILYFSLEAGVTYTLHK